MKKIYSTIIIVSIFLLIVFWSFKNNSAIVKDGTYVLAETEKEPVTSPRVNISQEEIFFTYDVLSSYLIVGDYTIERDVLTMRTRDDKYKYVFQVADNKLIFKADESSEVKLLNNQLGIKITNNSVFKLVED